VTLAPGADAASVLSRVENDPGCSVKDSFADLDLVPWGFHVLFDATWIRRASTPVPRSAALQWREVDSPADLAQWSRGHDLDVFGPALLAAGNLRFFHAPSSAAGFALHRTGDVVGASNTVAGAGSLAALWSDLVAIAGTVHPGLDLVGYEVGEDLEAALEVGFVSTGPLRVWIRQPPRKT
jgi:hypothetical protein